MAAKVRWMQNAWWVVTHHQGRRRKKRVGPAKADKRQAEAIAKKINAKLTLGEDFNDRRETLPCEAALRTWHRTYGPTMKYTAEVSALALINNHLAPYFGSMDLREIREAHLLAFVRMKVEVGLSPKTVLNALSVLSRVL